MVPEGPKGVNGDEGASIRGWSELVARAAVWGKSRMWVARLRRGAEACVSSQLAMDFAVISGYGKQ